MKKLLKLFVIFMQLGVCTFGGGSAMLALLQRVVVDKHKWATEYELLDYFAIGNTVKSNKSLDEQFNIILDYLKGNE